MRITSIACLAVWILGPQAVASPLPQCPEWSDEFHAAGVDGCVTTLLRHDDGGGEVLYVAGDITAAGGVPVSRLARWDGTGWTAVGAGTSGVARALAFYDDGSGPALYAGGPNFLERFDGVSWTSIPVSGFVEALTVHDDGGGAALIVGGSFIGIGGIAASGIARYDGTWNTLAGGVNGTIRAFATYDDGSGSRLILGGRFTLIAGVAANNIASWDGASYAALGAGVGTFGFSDSGVHCLGVFDDGQSGSRALYVGGSFPDAGGLASTNWARWSAGGWQALPAGPSYFSRGITVITDGPAPLMYITGGTSVYTWDGAVVSELTDSSIVRPTTLATFDDGNGQRVFMGSADTGSNAMLHGTFPNNFLRWDAGAWSTVSPGKGVGSGCYDGVLELTVHDDGSGPVLVAGGGFASAGGVEATIVAAYDGQTWAGLGNNLCGQVSGLAARAEGGGSVLYATGPNICVDGVDATVARFDGALWSDLGDGFSGGSGGGRCLATFREGASENLFLGGAFLVAAGISAQSLVRWDGNGWSAVGAGLEGPIGIHSGVWDMVRFDDGSGEALYVAGDFTSAGGIPVAGIARWDGSSWSALGAGLEAGAQPTACTVCDLEIFDGPDGEILVATGNLALAGGSPVSGIASWDGAAWSALGSGLGGAQPFGGALASFDPDGNGERLYVSGRFDTAGGLPVGGLAMWDGSAWSAAAVFEGGDIGTMLSFDDGGGRALFVAGNFDSVDGTPSANIARFADPCGADLGNSTCTALPNSTGLRGRMRADGSSSVAAADVTLSARNLPGGASTLLFHGPDPRLLPFGDGLRCVGGDLQRIYPIGSAGTGGQLDRVVNFAAPYAVDYVAGSTFLFQGWYRDGMAGASGFNTTDALEIAFRP